MEIRCNGIGMRWLLQIELKKRKEKEMDASRESRPSHYLNDVYNHFQLCEN